jgi:hypothetical protein
MRLLKANSKRNEADRELANASLFRAVYVYMADAKSRERWAYPSRQ